MRICHEVKEASIFYYLKQQSGLTRAVIAMIIVFTTLDCAEKYAVTSPESGLC